MKCLFRLAWIVVLLRSGSILPGVYAQAPDRMSYQAVVRNSSGALVANQAIGMRIRILQGSTTGTAVYAETHTTTSNANGLVTLTIGSGTLDAGNLATINWANGPYFIQTETDLTGGTNYTITGTSQLLSVPYALYAESSGSSTPGPTGPTGPPGPPGPPGNSGVAGPPGSGFSNGTMKNQLMYWNDSAWVTLNPGTDGQVLTLCGGNLGWTTPVGGSCVSNQYPSGSVFCATGPTLVVEVTNPATGRVWMDRNLGASQVATSSTDVNSYGDLYQWGRGNDGHQCRNSGIVTILSSSDQPAHGDFIQSPNSPYDWRSPQNANLWQGVNGVNNPCPNGFRLPTEAEFNAERASWVSANAAGAMASPLKFPVAGRRIELDGTINNLDSAGYLWTSTPSGIVSRVVLYDATFEGSFTFPRATGVSVRCIKN